MSILDYLFAPILTRIDQLESDTMTAFDDLNTKIDAMSTKVEEANAKADQMIALVADLRAQIQALSNAGGATPEQLAALSAKIDAATASLGQQITEDQAALSPSLP